jgi:precorrin-6A/cobalt-precorrin-6A reductase
MSRHRILILGGSTEASALARALAQDARFAVELSLAGRTKAPVLPPVPHRIGGFGGAAGLAVYLRAGGFSAVVNATHPFAARMSANAVAGAALAGVALLRVLRPAWTPVAGDAWTVVPTMDAAAAATGAEPCRVLLTIGQKDLAAFRAAPQHRYVVRSVDPPPPESLPPLAEVLTARGPFDEAAEHALMVAHGIEVVVTKNSGGSATAAKLVAARTLHIPLVMVARPVEPAAETVRDVAAALAWLEGQANASICRGE